MCGTVANATRRSILPHKGRSQEKGLEVDDDIVCYSTGGVRSSWLYFVLKLAGYQKVRNYPGSWWEWSRDFACPVEKDFQGLQKVLGIEAPTRPS
jgi:thiosulfate/3-mercaptopyruvate sulfurtransferase